MKARSFSIKLVTCLCAILSAAFLALGIVFARPVSAADVTNEAEQSILVMDYGASLRIGEEDGNNGMKYSFYVTNDDYVKLMENVGEGKDYAEVTFGILIAPATSNYVLDYDHVFGDLQAYKWDSFDTELGQWNKTYDLGNTNGATIINIYGQHLTQEVLPEGVEGEGNWRLRGGSMTNIKEANLINNFQGIGYAELKTADGSCDYIFAQSDDNVRMPYAVAKEAVIDPQSGLTPEQIEWILANYIDNVEKEFCVELGLITEDVVNVANYLPVDVDYTNLTWEIKQYIDQYSYVAEGNTPIYFKGYLSKDITLKMTDSIVDITGLEGQFTLLGKLPGKDFGYQISFDKYNPEKFVWNNGDDLDTAFVAPLYSTETRGYLGDGTLSLVSEAEKAALGDRDSKLWDPNANYYKFQSNFAKENPDNKVPGFNLKLYPLHSKEYYANVVKAGDTKMLMSYYFTYDDAGAPASNRVNFLVGEGYGNTNKFTYDSPYTWDNNVADGHWTSRLTTGTLDLANLVDRWQNVTNSVNGGGFLGFRKGYDGTAYDGNFTLYFGNLTLLGNWNYDIETYVANKEGGYDLESTETKSALKYASVSVDAPAKDGYKLNTDISNLSGVNDGFLTLTLYYDEFASTTSIIPGIISDSRIDTGVTNVNTWTLKQYILKADGDVDLTLKHEDESEYTVKAKVVDVTEQYSTLLNTKTGKLNVSALDGIFTVYAESDNFASTITFEKQIEGKFTWNTLPCVDSVLVRGRFGSSAVPTGTMTFLSQEDMAQTGLNLNSVNYNSDGWYLKFDTTLTSSNDGIWFWIFPTHTLDYYKAWAANGKVALNSPVTIQGSSADSNTAQAGMVGFNEIQSYYRENGAGSDTWGSTSGWSARTYWDISQITTYWDRCVISNVGGQGLVGTKNITKSAQTWYVGNPYIITMEYKTNVYLEQVDGSYALSTADSKVTNASFGAYITATPASITNYTFDQTSEFNVLEGMNNGMSLELYYTLNRDAIQYKVENYLQQPDGSYIVDPVTSYADTAELGATVTHPLPTISGYTYDEGHEGEVISGTNDMNLVLKAYYNLAQEVEEITETLSGIQSGATIELKAQNITSIVVNQYVVRQDGDVTLSGLQDSAIKVKSAVVTDAYKDFIDAETGVVDATKFDGIYTITALGDTVKHTLTFEQQQAGTFTWNNLVDNVSAKVGGRYAGNAAPTGTMSVISVDQVKSEVTYCAGTKFNNSGIYVKYNATAQGSSNGGIGFMIFPVHTLAYYNVWAVDAASKSILQPVALIGGSTGGNENKNTWYLHAEGTKNYFRANGSGGDTWGSQSGWAERKPYAASLLLTEAMYGHNTNPAQKGMLGSKDAVLGTWYVGCPFIV